MLNEVKNTSRNIGNEKYIKVFVETFFLKPRITKIMLIKDPM